MTGTFTPKARMMARLDRRKKPNREIHNIEDVPIPPEYMTPEQQVNSGVLNLDAMDLGDGEGDEDGGVGLLDDDHNSNGPGSNISFLNNFEMIQRCHQQPVTNPEHVSELWRLPITPLYVKHSVLKRGNITHRTALAYQDSCRLIRAHWECEPTVCIPDDLRKQTPYSLAMLCQLSDFASNTKQNFALAQLLLMGSWRERFHTLMIPSDHTSIHIVETLVNDKPACERHIQENVFGLMLHDVSEAIKTLKEHRREGRLLNNSAQQKTNTVRQQAKSDRQQLKKERQRAKREAKLAWQESTRSLIAERVTQRRREYKTTPHGHVLANAGDLGYVRTSSHEPVHSVAQGVSVAPPNSPVLAGNSFSLFSQNSSVPRNLPSGEPKNEHENGTPNQSVRRQHTHDSQISSLIKKMGMDGSEQSGKRRLKRLQTGGLSRIGSHPVTLPSERFSLRNVPTLHETTPTTSPSDLARLGQQPLPG